MQPHLDGQRLGLFEGHGRNVGSNLINNLGDLSEQVGILPPAILDNVQPIFTVMPKDMLLTALTQSKSVPGASSVGASRPFLATKSINGCPSVP